MDLFNSVLNWVVPPASLLMLAFAWPALTFVTGCEWLYNLFNSEIVEDKVVIITGASSGIGEVIISPLFPNIILSINFEVHLVSSKVLNIGFYGNIDSDI